MGRHHSSESSAKYDRQRVEGKLCRANSRASLLQHIVAGSCVLAGAFGGYIDAKVDKIHYPSTMIAMPLAGLLGLLASTARGEARRNCDQFVTNYALRHGAGDFLPQIKDEGRPSGCSKKLDCGIARIPLYLGGYAFVGAIADPEGLAAPIAGATVGAAILIGGVFHALGEVGNRQELQGYFTQLDCVDYGPEDFNPPQGDLNENFPPETTLKSPRPVI